jgi:hypothetical protein
MQSNAPQNLCALVGLPSPPTTLNAGMLPSAPRTGGRSPRGLHYFVRHWPSALSPCSAEPSLALNGRGVPPDVASPEVSLFRSPGRETAVPLGALPYSWRSYSRAPPNTMVFLSCKAAKTRRSMSNCAWEEAFKIRGQLPPVSHYCRQAESLTSLPDRHGQLQIWIARSGSVLHLVRCCPSRI